MCPAQGPQCSDAVRLKPAASQSRVKHATTEQLRLLLGILFHLHVFDTLNG